MIIMKRTSFSLLILVELIFLSLSVNSTRSPIVFIPGILGSQMVARVNGSLFRQTSDCKNERQHHSDEDWFQLWLDMEIIYPYFDKCFVDYIKLLYDPITKQYTNNEGVEIEVKEGLQSVEYLSEKFKIKYLHEFVTYFEKQGYTGDKDLNAAPYDWRLSPEGLFKSGYYDNLYQLIEKLYMDNNRTPITLIAHSLGGPVILYFLRQYLDVQQRLHIPLGWKDTRIKQLVTLSGVFGGSVEIVESLVSGRKLRRAVSTDPFVMRQAQRSFPSMVSMLPSRKLWTKNEVMISQPNKNYTVLDYEELFEDLKYTNGSRMLKELENLTRDNFAIPPNVTFYCFYGTNVSTPVRYVYGDSFPDHIPRLVEYGNGDGTVNERSLQSCRLWSGQQELPLIEKGFPNVKHFEMVTNTEILAAIKELVIH